MSEETKGFDLSNIQADTELSDGGVWVDFYDDSKLKIAQNQNTKHQAYLNMSYKKNRRKLDLDDDNADRLAEKISIEGLARHILLDWKGITIDGVDTPYNYKIGIEAMTKSKVLKDEVESQSRRFQNFKQEAEEQDLEDVKPISPGNLDGESQSE